MPILFTSVIKLMRQAACYRDTTDLNDVEKDDAVIEPELMSIPETRFVFIGVFNIFSGLYPKKKIKILSFKG